MHRHSSYMLTGVLLVLAGCDSNPSNRATPPDTRPVSAEDVKRANREAVEANAKYLAQEKDKYREQLQKKLDEWNQQISRWDEKIKEASGQMKEKLIEQKAEFEKKRDAFVQKLKQLDQSSGAAWQDMKEGLNKAYEDMKDAFQKANEHFK